jgi:F-type H+-transporting ATPase subunit alpha
MSDLFNSGQRPAIDAGNSVSRVGSSAQTGTMKSVAGRVRVDLAQYNSLAAFAQFGSDLDQSTLQQLERGKRVTEILKQPQYNPLAEPFEYLSIWAISNGFTDNVPVEEIQRFESDYHDYMKRSHPKIIEALSEGKKPDETLIKQIEKATTDFKKVFKV